MRRAVISTTLSPMRLELQNAGFRVFEASHSSLYGAAAHWPDLVLLDGLDPDVNALSRYLRGAMPGTVIVHLGGNASDAADGHAAMSADLLPLLDALLPCKRVLVIEDNVDACTLFSMALTDRGHHVDSAFDATSGLQLLLSNHYDCAIIDIGLPDKSGIDVVNEARAKLGERAPRFIAITGFSDDEVRLASRDAGFQLHLVKPVALSTLLHALRTKP